MTAVAFTISIEQGRMQAGCRGVHQRGRGFFRPWTKRVRVSVVPGRHAVWCCEAAAAGPWRVRRCICADVDRPPYQDNIAGRRTRRIRVGDRPWRVGGRPRTIEAARSASRSTRVSCVCALAAAVRFGRLRHADELRRCRWRGRYRVARDELCAIVAIVKLLIATVVTVKCPHVWLCNEKHCRTSHDSTRVAFVTVW